MDLIAKRLAALNERHKLYEECKTLLAAVDSGLTDEKRSQFEENERLIEQLDGDIARYERAMQMETESSSVEIDKVEDVVSRGERLANDPKLGFDNFGQYTRSVIASSNPSGNSVDEKLDRAIRAVSGMSEGIASDGGFLIPPEFSSMIWDGANKASDNLFNMTDNFSFASTSMKFNALDETSRADGSRHGGMTGYWMAEADQHTKSKPKFRKITLEPYKLGVFVWLTDELLEDTTGVALESFITKRAADEFNFKISDAIINGTGAGMPLGILNANTTVSVSKETNQVASTVVSENINKMYSRLHANSIGNSVWFINQNVRPQLQELKIDVGTGGAPLFIPPGGISAAPHGTIFGRPVLPIESCATLGTTGDIIFADMRGYLAGTRGSMKSASSMHLRFDYDEVALKFIMRVDGQPWMADKLTPYKGTADTLSHFVKLNTRS